MKDVLFIASNRFEKVETPLRMAGYNVRTIRLHRSHKYRKYFYLCRDLCRAFSEKKKYVLITDGLDLVGIISAVFSKVSRMKLLIRLRGRTRSEFFALSKARINRVQLLLFIKGIIFYWMSRITIRLAGGIIANSNHTARELMEDLNIPEQLIKIVHIPCNLARFSDRRASCRKMFPNHRLILTATNFNIPGKLTALEDAFPSIADVLQKRIDIVFAVAGDGYFLKDLRKLTDERYKDLSERIHYLGYVSNVEDYLEEAELFLYFSYQDAYPNTVLEAMAMGKTVLTNYAEGMIEQITHQEDGIFVNVNERGELSKEVMHLLDSPELREVLGRKAIRKVKKDNSYEKIGLDFRSALEFFCFSKNNLP